MATAFEVKAYPEILAGGYSRDDVRMEYVVRVNALLRPDMTVLDFGAGRGKWSDDPVAFRRWMGDFRGRCAKVIACDVDPAVLDNPQVDERILWDHHKPLPFPDESIDLISAFSVPEHVEDTEVTAAELRRILRPGGWFCAWTPNKWGYVGIGARLIPTRFHDWVLHIVEPKRTKGDSFVPLYRMNTKSTLQRLFPPDSYLHCTYGFDGQPFYHAQWAPLFHFWRFLFWLLPMQMKSFYMVFIQKRETTKQADQQ